MSTPNDVLKRLSEVYSITLCEVGNLQDSRLNGPDGTAGLDLPTRTVFVSPRAAFERVLHEIAHIVTAPPGIEYDLVPEDFLLLQLERCWARGFRLSAKLVRSIYEWQGSTAAPLICGVEGAMLDEIADYEKSGPWRAGYHHLRSLDLIDAKNRPTLRTPRWTDEMLAAAKAAVTLSHEASPW